MLQFLGQAAREARESDGSRIGPVAVSVKGGPLSESTISRFENGKTWTRNPDATIGAYADVLNRDPIEFWERALELMRAARTSTA